MSKFKLFLTLLLVGLVPLQASAMVVRSSRIYIDQEKYPDWYRFVKKHRCEDFETEKVVVDAMIADEGFKKYVLFDRPYLEVNGEIVRDHPGIRHSPYKLRDLPYYYKGDQIDRIHFAHRLKNYFTTKDIKHFEVANKFLCRVHDEWVVIAQEVIGHPCEVQKLNGEPLREVKQWCQDMEHIDNTPANYRRTQNNKIVLIDSESYSFVPSFRYLPNEYDDPAINFADIKRQRALWRQDLLQKRKELEQKKKIEKELAINKQKKKIMQGAFIGFWGMSAGLVLHKCIVQSF